jgi:hypothetical protein
VICLLGGSLGLGNHFLWMQGVLYGFYAICLGYKWIISPLLGYFACYCSRLSLKTLNPNFHLALCKDIGWRSLRLL